MVVKRGLLPFLLTVAGFAWCAAALVLAHTWELGAAVAVDSAGRQVESASTLVEQEGSGVLIAVGLPAALAALVWIALHRACSRGGPLAGRVALWLIVALTGFCVLAGFSIGLFYVPAAALLMVAWLRTPGAGITAVPR